MRDHTSHSQRRAVIKAALEMAALLLSVLTAIFSTSRLQTALPQLLAVTVGALCLVLVGALSQALIELVFKGSPSNVVEEAISGIFSAAIKVILEALSRLGA